MVTLLYTLFISSFDVNSTKLLPSVILINSSTLVARISKYSSLSELLGDIQSLHKLDVGGHAHNQHKVNEIIDTIRNEFPDLEISSIMLGIVSICHLGKPYEVHTLDITGQIIEHYKNGQVLPGGLEKARSIAMRGGYDFIEVYTDCCRAISANGTVSVISN